jgi:hypothetical protein
VIRTNIPLSLTIRAERKLADRACVPARSTRNDAKALVKLPEELRAALAEALVHEEFPTFHPDQVNAARPLGYANMVESLWPADSCKKCNGERRGEFEAARTKARKLTEPLVFGECAVRTAPANAHRLLLTKAGSPEEKAALHSLRRAFERCVPEGSRFGMSRTAVRDLIALNYYRLARAPRVQPVTGAAIGGSASNGTQIRFRLAEALLRTRGRQTRELGVAE